MRVLAIDSAERSGVAVLDGSRLAYHDVIIVRAAAELDAAAALVVYRPEVVAIEEPFIHPPEPFDGDGAGPAGGPLAASVRGTRLRYSDGAGVHVADGGAARSYPPHAQPGEEGRRGRVRAFLVRGRGGRGRRRRNRVGGVRVTQRDEEGSMRDRRNRGRIMRKAVARIWAVHKAAAAGDREAAEALERARPRLRELTRQCVELIEREHDRLDAVARVRALTPEERRSRRRIAKTLAAEYAARLGPTRGARA